MFYYLISSLKRRIILELRDSFSKHPVYNKIVPYIQNKYSFKERPQFGIVVKGSSANRVQLSADNFVGTVASHVMLSYVGEPKYPIEWVREDLNAVKDNGGVFPTPPGIYYIDILEAPTNATEQGSFRVRTMYTVMQERVMQYQSGPVIQAQLQHPPDVETVRLWDNGTILLTRGKDYVVDDTGAITFLYAHKASDQLYADYRYAGDEIGPRPFQWNTADFTTLPGVVLAFGKRAVKGDTVAVIVYADRVDTAEAYGGRFEVSFDLEVISTDPMQTEEIADFAVMSFWGEKRSALSTEGIEILDMSIGGESEDTYDETADLFYYSANLSLQIQSDWEIHVPLPLVLAKVSTTSAAGDAAAPPGQSGPSTLHVNDNTLFYQTTPVLVGHSHDYERIR